MLPTHGMYGRGSYGRVDSFSVGWIDAMSLLYADPTDGKWAF